MLLVLSTHSLDPCLWGETDHPVFGPTAIFIFQTVTPAGSVHKSRGDNVVGAVEEMCVVCVDVTEGA